MRQLREKKQNNVIEDESTVKTESNQTNGRGGSNQRGNMRQNRDNRERPERPERVERPERPERVERPERAERPERQERQARTATRGGRPNKEYNNNNNYNNNQDNQQQGNKNQDSHYKQRQEAEPEVENPYKDFKFIEQEMIDENFKIPAIPAQPKLLSFEEKEKRTGVLDEEIRKLENQRSNVIANINESRRKIKKNKKPDDIQASEQRKSKLIDSKRKLFMDVDSLNKEKKEALKLLQGSEPQGRQNKGMKALPQDEEELDQMIEGWNDYFETKSLKKQHEEEVFKKLVDLEKLRPSLGDVNNLNKEIMQAKKRLTTLKDKLKETYEQITSINLEIEDLDVAINTWIDSQRSLHQADEDEIASLEQSLERLKESIRVKRDEKRVVTAEFKANKKVMDCWKEVRDNIKWAEKMKENIMRGKERETRLAQEKQEREKLQMNAHEVKIEQARQAILALEEIRKASGKKIVLKMEQIQLFSKLDVNYPKTKDDIATIIDQLNTLIQNENQANQ